MNERELERIARHMGERAARSVNPERVAAGVLARLRAAPPETRRPLPLRLFYAAPTALRVAAAVALIATGGLLARGALRDRPEAPALVAPFLPELSLDELSEVLDSMVLEAPVPEDLTVGLTDLTEAQLRELLKLMEG
ncbi:MAG TPA: hypothetical protein VNL18_13305 [Gemmatimonadales bacterium]|nr:hypothetical protein [Gemmatimonadales bacterium]